MSGRTSSSFMLLFYRYIGGYATLLYGKIGFRQYRYGRWECAVFCYIRLSHVIISVWNDMPPPSLSVKTTRDMPALMICSIHHTQGLASAVLPSAESLAMYIVEPWVFFTPLIVRISACVETRLGGVSGVILGLFVSPPRTLPDFTIREAILNRYSDVCAIFAAAAKKEVSEFDRSSSMKSYCLYGSFSGILNFVFIVRT